MTIGLGSGRAVWATLDLLRDRGVRAAAASSRTEQLLREAGIDVVELDGEVRLSLAIDGADEIDPDLGLIKGGGAAHLREKLVVSAAERFVVVAESSKKVARLGETRGVPVEVIRFAWQDTRRRLLEYAPSADLRADDAGAPLLTDEGNHILDVGVPDGDIHAFADRLKAEVGVVEHGLFLGMTSLALLGNDDGSVEQISGR
jgi:ribose 5-phosphate isomerase A